MKLRTIHHPLGFQVIDDNEFDGASDAGPQLVGEGSTPDAARRDFMDKWLEREVARDCQRGVGFAQSWDSMIGKLFGRQS